MSEFLETIRNIEEDEIDPADLTPLISSMNVPIVTVLEDKNDRVEDADEDKDEDEDEDENEDKDKDESEDEDENSNLPGLQTDKSSIDDLLGDSDSDSEVGWRASGERRPEDEENDIGFDPPSNLWPKEYQFPNAEPEEILKRLEQQVKDLLNIMEVKMSWPAVYGPENDLTVSEGLENISVMGYKLSKIVLSLKGEINRAQRARARILQVMEDDGDP